MKRLYEAQGNAMNYMVLEDTDTEKACTFDWDLSEEEVDKIVCKFKNGTLSENDFNNSDWYDSEELSNFVCCVLLAYN